MKLIQAKDIAVKICTKLQPFCDKVNIAGSIRRLKPEVKDIEICVIPKKDIVTLDSIFGDKMETIKTISKVLREMGNDIDKATDIDFNDALKTVIG